MTNKTRCQMCNNIVNDEDEYCLNCGEPLCCVEEENWWRKGKSGGAIFGA